MRHFSEGEVTDTSSSQHGYRQKKLEAWVWVIMFRARTPFFWFNVHVHPCHPALNSCIRIEELIDYYEACWMPHLSLFIGCCSSLFIIFSHAMHVLQWFASALYVGSSQRLDYGAHGFEGVFGTGLRVVFDCLASVPNEMWGNLWGKCITAIPVVLIELLWVQSVYRSIHLCKQVLSFNGWLECWMQSKDSRNAIEITPNHFCFYCF